MCAGDRERCRRHRRIELQARARRAVENRQQDHQVFSSWPLPKPLRRAAAASPAQPFRGDHGGVFPPCRGWQVHRVNNREHEVVRFGGGRKKKRVAPSLCCCFCCCLEICLSPAATPAAAPAAASTGIRRPGRQGGGYRGRRGCSEQDPQQGAPTVGVATNQMVRQRAQRQRRLHRSITSTAPAPAPAAARTRAARSTCDRF